MSFDYEQWKQSQFSATPHQEAASIPFPASITLAGMIWAAAGVIALLTEAVLFLQTGNMRSPGSVLGGLFLLYGGIRAISGTSPSTARGGMGSIVLGFLWIGVGIMLPAKAGAGANNIVLLVSFAMGGAFVLAGFLAMSGDSSYQKWRNAQLDKSTP